MDQRNAYVVKVSELAQTYGVPAPTFRPVARLRNSARASVRRRCIEYGPEVAALPRAQRDWVAAHELAHIAAGHRPPTGPLVGIGAMLALAVATIGGVLASLAGAANPSSSLLAGAMMAAIVVGAVSLLWSLAGRRRQEAEADQIARDWGHPVTAEIAAAIAAKERAHGIGPRWPVSLSDHPKPYDRINER